MVDHHQHPDQQREGRHQQKQSGAPGKDGHVLAQKGAQHRKQKFFDALPVHFHVGSHLPDGGHAACYFFIIICIAQEINDRGQGLCALPLAKRQKTAYSKMVGIILSV